jgi:hypothetical protein
LKIDRLREKLNLVPRNEGGDPCFRFLESDGLDEPFSVLGVFTREEVVELVNRCLYQLEYQQRSHAKYVNERNALMKPVKDMFKVLYPHSSFAKATNEQLRECVEALKGER